MDIVLLAAAVAAGLAGFYSVTALQGVMSGTRRIVRERALGPRESAPAAYLAFLQSIPQARLRLSPAGERTELDLIRADWAIKVHEYRLLRIFVAAGGAVVALLLAAALSIDSSLLRIGLVVLTAAIGYILPARYVEFRKDRRLAAIDAQLPEALTSMAKSIRAGIGLLQALDYAAVETPAPLGLELARALRDLQLGGEPELVFNELNRRVGSADLGIVTTAIMIQRTVGGNLSEILSNVSTTIRERRDLKAEVQVITSQQRLSGNLVALMPILVALVFFALNPEFAGLLIEKKAGQIALAIGIFFEIVGFWLIRRLAVIEV